MDKRAPVAFNPKTHAAGKRASSTDFRQAYDALEDEFAALSVLLRTRKDAGTTQAEVADMLATQPPESKKPESADSGFLLSTWRRGRDSNPR